MEKSDIGMIGMAVMGENLSVNMERNGFTVSVFDVREDVVDAFVNGKGKGKKFFPAHSYEEFVQSIERPRKIMMMIRAGEPVDQVISALLPLLDKGDIVIDGGNSRFSDTMRRSKYLEEQGINFIGTGVSGGEEGALNGPSLMPGGTREAWEEIRPVFQAICAKTGDGSPCCDYVGENGAGHFVKMVHNGIEYGDMQLICEAYQLLRDGLGLSNEQMHEVFAEWNKTELDSYLIEITRDILGYRDETGEITLDKILDRAGQKGTGKWASIAALDEAVPLTLISEAVFARCLSAQKDERVRASKLYVKKKPVFIGAKNALIESIRKALYASKIVSYSQGYALMRAAADDYGWKLNYGGIALMWRGGCIIRSVLLEKIREAFDKNPNLDNLLTDDYFRSVLQELLEPWREVVAFAVSSGIPVPAFSSALAWFDGYTTERLPANLLQAQRDYFGAHTYERVDAPLGEHFHTNWTGHGGNTSAGTYNA